MSPPVEYAKTESFRSVFRHTPKAIALVWETSRGLSVGLGLLSLLAGLLPAGIAYVGKHIVDAVVAAAESGLAADQLVAVKWVGVELGLVVALAVAQRGILTVQSLLRALLGQRVNVMILEKALTLDLRAFEDPKFYDQLVRARREASSRPLQVVTRTFGIFQNAFSLVAYGALLLELSPWAVLVIVVAAVPAFIVETRFSADAFRLFRWRAPETRKQMYLESVLARDEYAKEVRLFGLGPLFLERYRKLFEQLFVEDKKLTLRRGFWGFALGLLSTAALYGAYGWIVVEAATSRITLGEMTMYLLIFKQGQSALSAILTAIGGMYEDNLYLSNLYEFLDYESALHQGTATEGTVPGDGIRFEDVSFTYPGAPSPAIDGVTLHLAPGSKLAFVGENGAGKTTLIKLLTGLYAPTDGRVLLDGLDVMEWDQETLHRRVGVIFQDYVRYQMLFGENIGVGDVRAFGDEERWVAAADKGMADDFIDRLPDGYQTQLGRWFKGGVDLSIGQWQKVALSRAFMREEADVLVLDEPTASMDAEAEAVIFERFRELAEERMVILISHRFSTVRMADQIVVLDRGKIVERGDHESLLSADGRYAHLFKLQAAGYR